KESELEVEVATYQVQSADTAA
ncbi:hypothetical protein A2U01_0050917, partial [Trifolium medium]|nr:hypothetical protein [Trifolium medium]